MENATIIQSAHDGTTLEFGERDRDYYRVKLTGPNFQGDCRVYSYEPTPGISAFFQEMAGSWRGWQGAKQWASLEGELKLDATTDTTGHICLLVELCSGPSPFRWRVSAVLLLEAGSMERIAQQIEDFMKNDQEA